MNLGNCSFLIIYRIQILYIFPIFWINLNPSASNASHGDLNSTRYTIGTSGLSIASASPSAGPGNGLKDLNKKSYYIEKEIKSIKDNPNNQIVFIVLSVIGLLIIGYYYKKYTEEGWKFSISYIWLIFN